MFDTLSSPGRLPTQDETTFSLAIIVFSPKWEREPAMLPLSLPTAPARDYHYHRSCLYSCQLLTGLIHVMACEYGSASSSYRLRSRLNHCPNADTFHQDGRRPSVFTRLFINLAFYNPPGLVGCGLCCLSVRPVPSYSNSLH